MYVGEYFLSELNGNEIDLQFALEPVSMQNSNEKKLAMRKQIQMVTERSPFLVTGPVFVSIDYYCSNIKRLKNHGAYDLDNIVKPLLDSLSGVNGILLDDTQVERVTVNWIDTYQNEEVHMALNYLPFVLRSERKTVSL